MRSRLTAQANIWPLVAVVCFVLLTLIGTLFVYDSSLVESYNLFGHQYGILFQHLSGLALGIIALGLGFLIPAKWMIKFSPIFYGLGLILLIMVFLPVVGVSVNGASRWIEIMGLRLQPVELMKPATLILLAGLLYQKKHQLAYFLGILGIPAILVIIQPDLGSLLVLAGSCVLLYFLSDGSLKHLGLLGLLALPLLIIAIVLAPYRLARLTTFFNPDSDPLGASFHIRQITLALGQGRWLGKGIGNSVQKFAYIPETSTDSIFAIVGEEVGFLGAGFIIIMYAVLITSLVKVVMTQNSSPLLKLTKLGLVGWIAIQTTLNLAAVVGLVPLTGIPLPLFSYGRSAQVALMFSVGFILRGEKK